MAAYGSPTIQHSDCRQAGMCPATMHQSSNRTSYQYMPGQMPTTNGSIAKSTTKCAQLA